MNLSFRYFSLAGALLLCITSSAHASDQNFISRLAQHASAQESVEQPIELVMSVWRLNPVGHELEETISATPGDTLRYKVAYSNTSAQKIKNIQASIPVPANTQLLQVNTHDYLSASLDGEKYNTWPLKREVIQASGQVHEELVPLSEIRSVSWRIPELQKQATMVFYVDVNVIK